MPLDGAADVSAPASPRQVAPPEPYFAHIPVTQLFASILVVWLSAHSLNTYLLQDQPRGATLSDTCLNTTLPRTPCSKSCCEHTCAAASSLPQFPLPLRAIRLCLAGLDPPFVPVHCLTTRAALDVVGCLRQYLFGCDGQQSWEALAGADGGLPSNVLLARRGEMVVSTWDAPESCKSSGCALRGGALVGVQISSFVRHIVLTELQCAAMGWVSKASVESARLGHTSESTPP